MVLGTVDLVRRRGVSGTSLRDVVRHTKTPRGSLGHHFPQGKGQLLAEAIAVSRTHISRSLAAALEQRGAVQGLRAFAEQWREMLESTRFEAGCAVLPFAIEHWHDGSESEQRVQRQLRQSARETLEEWRALLADALRRESVPRARADSLATVALAAFEGAIVLCRVSRSVEPLEQASGELERMFSAALMEAR